MSDQEQIATLRLALKELSEASSRALSDWYAKGHTPKPLRAALIQAVEASGFSISGPTDVRAVEHGEPAWVCNARAAVAGSR